MAERDHGIKEIADVAGQQLARLAGLKCSRWRPLESTLPATLELLADRVFLARQGRERFVVVGAPNAVRAPIAPALRRFLSAQGRSDLSRPDASTWTVAEALSPIAWLTGRPIRLATAG